MTSKLGVTVGAVSIATLATLLWFATRPPELVVQREAFQRKIGAVDRVIGRLMAYLVVEAFSFSFYLAVLPYLYGIPRLGSVWLIAAVAFPFILAVGGLGMVMAKIFRNPVLVQLVAACLGLPFLFLSGFSWPADAMPPFIRPVALVLPSTSAINALVNVGQMGANLQEVGSHVLTLVSLAVIYCGLAILLEAKAGTDQCSE